LIEESENIEKIKYICENLLLVINDFEFLTEYSDIKIKKIFNLFKDEKPPLNITEMELFGFDFNKEDYKFRNEKDFFNNGNQIKNNENSIDIVKLIKFFTKMFEIKINLTGKNIVLFNNIQEEIPPQILFDEKKLKQMIFILLSNAIKFTTFGKIGIKLEYNKEKSNLIFYILIRVWAFIQKSLKKLENHISKLIIITMIMESELELEFIC